MLFCRVLRHERSVVVKDEVISFVHLLDKGCQGHISIWFVVTIYFTICSSMNKRRLFPVFDVQKSRVEGICISQIVSEGDTRGQSWFIEERSDLLSSLSCQNIRLFVWSWIRTKLMH